MKKAGISDEAVRLITEVNPTEAFAFEPKA